ncbi:MAG: MBL fold metallo-hydrolase [Caldimicrobium sp.]
MRITILGSGTGWITSKRSSPAYLVSRDNFHLLLDFGPGTLRQLLKIGLNLNDITAIFISHFHPDHISDLIPFLFATRYRLGYQRKEGFELIVHKNFLELYEGLKKAFGHWVCPPEDLMKLKLVSESSSFTIGPFRAQTIGVNHNPESLAIKLEVNEKTLVYSGDTGFCEDLIEFSKGVTLLILECANSENVLAPGHLSPKEIAEIAGKANPETLILTHFYPHSENPNLEIIKEKFEGKIILAEDFLTLEL